MRRLTVNPLEAIAGAAVVAFGLFVLHHATGYELGSARRMGPGYFPTLLGLATVLFGLGIILVEGRRSRAPLPEELALRALGAVVLAIGAFVFLIERFGLVPAVIVTVMISAFAEPRPMLLRAALLAVGLAGATALIFPVGLGLRIAILKW